MRLARFIFSLVLTSFSLGKAEEPTSPHYSKPEVRQEIVAAVEGQMLAFRKNDFAKAYQFAARALRAQFSQREFSLMIVRTYPMIALNERCVCGLPVDDGTDAVLSVDVFAKGKSATYRYTLVREAGAWRVTGVLPEKPRPADI